MLNRGIHVENTTKVSKPCTKEIHELPDVLPVYLCGIIRVAMAPVNDYEQRIQELCQRVIALPEASEEFKTAMQELRTAIHERMREARTRAATLAALASRNESQAAD